MASDTPTEALRDICADEWDHLLNKTFSTPMAVEHLAQFVLAREQQATRQATADLAEALEIINAMRLGLSLLTSQPMEHDKGEGEYWIGRANDFLTKHQEARDA
jgi:hypothetical protein